MCIISNSLLVASNASFKGNTAYPDSLIHIMNSAAILEKCNFIENQMNEGYNFFYFDNNHNLIYKFETHRCSFIHGYFSLKSNMKSFEEVVVKENIIDYLGSFSQSLVFKPQKMSYAWLTYQHTYYRP